MSSQKNWTEYEENFLVNNYPTMGGRWCANQLNRKINSVNVKAYRLNLKRNGDCRYQRPIAPDGYTVCFHCKQVLPDGQFYRKDKDGSYGKKTSLCKSCTQEAGRRYYKNNKEKYERTRKENPIKVLLKNIKARAKKNNISFDLNVDDLVLPDACPVLGIKIIPFDNSDNSPSVDRFIPELGYVRGNCQIISKRANHIKNNATLEEIEKLYLWMKDYLS